VPKAWDGYAMSEHIIRIVPDRDKLDPSYIYSFLRTHYAQDILARGVFGSVIDEITPEFIGSISMPIPKSEKILENLVSKTARGLCARDEAIELLSASEEEINSRLLDQL
jgi:restriction endonuclease S subunit